MAITLADFTKIWASTSPLTPYTFSDPNYAEGWNFVGSTPPARQMWDSIQKQNDEKMKYIVDNFLPLSGGTMTGAIVGNPLTLTADDGNDSADLVLDPSGSATWNGKEVDRVNASGSGYIRYENGLQICWGSATPSSGVCNITFPQAFVNGYYTISAIGRPASSGAGAGRCVSVNGTTTSTTDMSITITDTNNAAAGTTLSWLAIGYWK